jgi:cellulose synthase/poly-beta-1,6-N-acetylglucosamine synthase-like glycosyltransferase
MWQRSGTDGGVERGEWSVPRFGGDDIEWQILRTMAYPDRFLASARSTAQDRGLTLAEELIRTGHLDPARWWQAVAEALRLRFYPSIYLPSLPETVPLPPFRRVRQVLGRTAGGVSRLYIAPRGIEIDRLARTLTDEPGLRGRYAIASPITISHAVVDAYAPAITLQARDQLRRTQPDMSASDAGAIRRRLFLVLALLCLIGIAAPILTLILLDGTFLILGAMRLVAAYHRPEADAPDPLSDAELPTYAVLVPLYREARVVASLTASLRQLDYPRHKLTILLIVEADDVETRDAARKACRNQSFRLIVVPPSLPRTKPKALCWALPFTTSDLVTIYDAEDRPAPDQLRRAATAFAYGGADLACVQAALEVDHLPASRNWLARQFALEYRVLFRSLLPWLARHQLFLPIGGTSNHFRREALVRTGAWDPFNVTEDADLAVRIMRMGGRIDVVASTTSEEAPLTLRQWHLQRVRWMKGWLQTCLVHFGHPIRLARDVGLRQLALVLILLPGQIVAALAYPIGLLLLGLESSGVVPVFADRAFSGDMILSLHLAAFTFGWLGALAAIIRTARRDPGRIRIGVRDLMLVPVYWLLLFFAAIAAPIELIRQPFRWNKTSHGHALRRSDVAPMASAVPEPSPPSRRSRIAWLLERDGENRGRVSPKIPR